MSPEPKRIMKVITVNISTGFIRMFYNKMLYPYLPFFELGPQLQKLH